MKLFFFKPKEFSPLLFIITQLSTKESTKKLESMAHEIFQVLIEQNMANDTNILIFSIIKDYEKSTANLILPAIKSNNKLVDRCHNNTNFVNSVVVQTLTNFFSEFCLEIIDDDIIIHPEKLNINTLIPYYKV